MRKQALRRYIYISDTKVDMFYQQIPPTPLKKILSDLGVDIKVPLLSLQIGNRGKDNAQPSRYEKVRIVERYLEQSDALCTVDTIDEPNHYIKDVLPMQYTVIPPPSQKQKPRLAYFGGSTEHTIVGLGGSTRHLISGMNSAAIGEPSSDL